MASTDEILREATKLGQLISEHDSAKKLEDILSRLQNDQDAQRALNDYNRHLQALAQKEGEGKPIEVEDKRKLEQLQRQVVMNPILRDFQKVQMDYVDLLRRVDEAMTGQTSGGPGAPGGPAAMGASPLLDPGMAGQ